MPSFVTPAKRRGEPDSDDGDSSEFDTPPTSNSAAKRQRLALRRAPTVDDAEDATTITTKEHQPGAIVRVWLRNFVTYKEAEFFPGPSLNMVIGPNGTGKSTLVCAICLGLGWGSQHLGRAKDVGDFVKHGASEAIIEIELKKDGKKYKTNPIIRAKIAKDGNKMNFALNGKQSTRKACMDVAKSFSVQIDNLCQFLPQDRVAEFAALSPVELLKSTQRAIASEEMIQWHEELVVLGRDLKKVEQATKTDQETLKNLESRQRMQEADVQRLRERDAIKKTIERLESVRSLVQFTNVKKQLAEAKDKHKAANDELNELIAREGPALRAVNAKQTYSDAVKLARDSLNQKCATADRTANSKFEEIKACDRRVELAQKNAEAQKLKLRDAKVEVKRLDGVINSLRKDIERGPPETDLAAIQEQIRDIARIRASIKTETETVRAQMTDLNNQMNRIAAEIKSLETEISNLDSQAGKKEQLLKRVNSDTYNAWQWVKKNQELFQKPILGPPIVECSVNHPDPKYTDMLEALIQQGDMFTFTAQTLADQRELHRLIKEQHGWRKTSTRCAPDPNRIRSPLRDEELKALGLEGWAKDFVQGPAPIVAMLCEAANLHRIGVCPREQTKEQFAAAERSQMMGWVTPRSSYRVMRRAEYGASATSTTVREVGKAKFWTDQPVDSGIKDGLQQKIKELGLEMSVTKEEFDSHNQKVKTLSEKYKEQQEREKPLEDEKVGVINKQKRFQGLEPKLSNSESKREDARQLIAQIQRTSLEHADEGDRIYLERATATLVYADAVMAYQKLVAEAENAEIMLIEAESDVKVLSEQNRTVKEMLEARKKEVDALAKEKQDIKKKGIDLQGDVAALRNLARRDEELQSFVDEFNADITLEQHDQEIDDARQRLDLIHDGNAGAIKQFMDREKTIEKLREKLESWTGAIEEVSGKLAVTRSKWEPKLDALVKQISSSFSHNMGQINCNGSVEISKHEDFDQWSIDIFVRFREGEPMTRLDAHRQSGGERAVSTIFYLMSLQTLTKSPFRVVDEINQGMDPRNERLVHSRMVAIATGNDDWQPPARETEDEEDMDQIIRQVDVERADLGTGTGSQYFLVTPKLLHDLRYEEGMTVMCINSGEHLASGDGMKAQDISFSRSLQAHRALRQAIAAA